MKKKVFLFILLTFISGQNLLEEPFDDSSNLPSGWEFIPDPSNYPPQTGTWQISSYTTTFNNNAPSATYYWAPSTPNTFANEFSGHYLYSPIISTNDSTYVIVRFQISLDGYPSPSGHYNGMNVEYSSDGGDWVGVLNYEISAGGGTVDILPRTESFYAVMGQTLQIRWETYGSNSYYIDNWHIDNVKVDVIQEIGQATIYSNNEDDIQKAIPGDVVKIEFELPNVPDAGSPFVLINSTEVSIENPNGLQYVAEYIVPEDATDGPISFLIDFSSDGISGPTCRNTTDGTNVLVDVTGPVSPVVTDNVLSIGTDNHAGIWSSTDTQVQVDVLVPKDTTVVGFNYEDGNSISFLENEGEVTIPWNDAYFVSNAFTIEAYINVSTNPQNYQGFLDFGDYGDTQKGFGFFLYSGGWRFYLKTTGTQKNDLEHVVASAPVNTWVHFAVRFQNGDLTLYRDGILVDSKIGNEGYSGSVDWSGYSGGLTLGSFDSTQTKYFNGMIDEVRLWNIARDANKIKAYRNVGLNGDEDGLIGYWRFDEGSPTSNSADLSATNNSAILQNGAQWIEGNSPFKFQTNDLDPNSIVGSRFQILSKVLTNDFALLGDPTTITQENSDNGTLSLFSTADELENIQDFAHNLEAQFSARLFDQAGNYADGNTSATELDIDLEANTPTLVSIVSNNTFPSIAKTGDIITISINYDENVTTPDVTVDANIGSVSSLGSNQFQVTYELLGSEPEGVINSIQSIVLDYLGNSGTYEGDKTGEGAKNVRYDRTNPLLNQVTIASNNEHTQWAKVGDRVNLNIIGSEVLLSKAATIQSQDALVSDLTSTQSDLFYDFLDTDTEGLVVFAISFSDSAGNEGAEATNTTDASWVVFDKTPPTDFNTGTVLAIGGNEIEGFWNSTNTSMKIAVPIAGDDTTITNGKIQIMGKVGSNQWENVGNTFLINESDLGSDKFLFITASEVESTTGFEDLNTISFKASISDKAGNITEGSISSDIIEIDQILPNINYVSYKSNFSDTTLATIGHEITLKIKTDENIQLPTMLISNQNAEILEIGSNVWLGKYIMEENSPEGVISFQIDEIQDLAGNPSDGTSTTTDGSIVIFDSRPPILNIVRIKSNNSDTTWAKVGDSIIIDFKTSEYLIQQSATILNQDAELSILSEIYQAKYLTTDLDTEGSVNFDLTIVDTLGLSNIISETTNSSDVIFDKTLPILGGVNIQSNNENNASIAIAGDDVILSFTPEELILIDSIIVTIANEIINVTENNGIYTGILTLTGSEPGGILPFTIDFADRASNRGLQVVSTTDDTYVNHDIVPPELLSISMYSNNQDTTWAKLGDTVFVKFTANEALDNFNILIAGNNSDYIYDGVAKYRAFHIMDIDDEESDISFSIEYTDLGGATGPTGSATTNGSIVRYDRTDPELSSVRMATNNSTGDSAGIGDMDSLFFSSSEANRSVSVIIADSNVIPIQDGFAFIAVREMQEEDQDGIINFSITLDDSAGNSTGQVFETNDGSFVWFDGTRPQLNQVSFTSTNIGDSSLAISGDTLVLDFASSEDLRDIEVAIAGFNADTIFFNAMQSSYQSWYVLQGVEEEGYVPFQITYSDLVGNNGDTIIATTDDTRILFDLTPPQNFQVDTLYVSGGNIVEGYWNASNDSIIIRFPVAIDDESLIGGLFQPQVKFGENEYINLGNEIAIIDISEDGFEILKIAREVFEISTGYSENINSHFTTKIIDKAGNETLGTSNGSLLHIDEIIPIIDSVRIKTNNILSDNWATILDTITLIINSNEGLNISSAYLEDNLMNIASSVNGTQQNCTYVVDIADSEGMVSFFIEYADTAGNIGLPIIETTNGEIVGIDNSKPIINSLMEGENNSDPNYYNKSDSITIYWTHNDTTSGIREVYFSLGSLPNSSNVVTWTNGGINDYGGWNNLNLENNTMYYGGAFVIDSAGNSSDTIWGNGVYIDNEIPLTGLINDGQWILEMDYTPDSTSLEYSCEGFSDNVGIEYYELSIGTGNDTLNIQDWYQTENIENVVINNLNLNRNIQYITYIRAVDSAKNFSDVINTDGIYFDDSEPRVMEIKPDFGDSSKVLSILESDTIKIKFNRLIYFYDIKIESSADSNFTTQEFYADSLITITWDDTLTSNDTLIVYLDSALAFNSLFITDTLYFYSHLWGDLNDDYDINIEDILQFNRSWPDIDIGPFSGTLPHIRPTLDTKANLIDLLSFAKIWQWRYFDLSLDTSYNVFRIDNGQFISSVGSQINISVPEKTFMAEIMVGNSNLDIEEMNIIQPNKNTFLFKSIDTSDKIIQFSLANYNSLDSNMTLVVPTNHSNLLSATIQYRFLDDFGNIISNGLNDYNIDLLPEQFLVYDNYPNPFNPITTIRYDLPNSRDIKIKIIDIMGRTIKSVENSNMTPGRKTFVWDGTNDFGNTVSTGIYFFQINAGTDSRNIKMLFLK